MVSCGANEQFGNVFLTKNANDWLRRAKAQVNFKLYPGVSAHAFPVDFSEQFPEWVKFILSVN